jgi:hypothetical protein
MDIDSEEFWQSELQEPAMMQGGKWNSNTAIRS